MTSEFNERLTVSPTEKAQIWIIGSRDQVAHLNQRVLRQTHRHRFSFGNTS